MQPFKLVLAYPGNHVYDQNYNKYTFQRVPRRYFFVALLRILQLEPFSKLFLPVHKGNIP